jgi:hypothetical protein
MHSFNHSLPTLVSSQFLHSLIFAYLLSHSVFLTAKSLLALASTVILGSEFIGLHLMVLEVFRTINPCQWLNGLFPISLHLFHIKFLPRLLPQIIQLWILFTFSFTQPFHILFAFSLSHPLLNFLTYSYILSPASIQSHFILFIAELFHCVTYSIIN